MVHHPFKEDHGKWLQPHTHPPSEDLIKDKPQRQKNHENKDASNTPRPQVKSTVESKGKGKVLPTD
jgi:hypothetical protein